MLKLLAIPSLDQEAECKQMLDDLRHLMTRGETLDNINMFIGEGILSNQCGERLKEAHVLFFPFPRLNTCLLLLLVRLVRFRYSKAVTLWRLPICSSLCSFIKMQPFELGLRQIALFERGLNEINAFANNDFTQNKPKINRLQLVNNCNFTDSESVF